MPEQDVAAVIRENIAAFNAGDRARYKRTLTSDTVYHELPEQRQAKGIDEVVEAAFRWREMFPDVKGEIDNLVVSETLAVFEIRWTGTHTGPLEGAGVTIPATGKKVSTAAVQVIDTKGGKIKSVRHYFDMMSLLQQLGAAPR